MSNLPSRESKVTLELIICLFIKEGRNLYKSDTLVKENLQGNGALQFFHQIKHDKLSYSIPSCTLAIVFTTDPISLNKVH